jgi:hypothetical protein
MSNTEGSPDHQSAPQVEANFFGVDRNDNKPVYDGLFDNTPYPFRERVTLAAFSLAGLCAAVSVYRKIREIV